MGRERKRVGSGRKRKIKWVERVSERERENRTIEEKIGTVGEKLEEKKCGKEKVGERERGREREKKLCVLEGEKIVIKTKVGRVGRENAYMGRDRKSACERTGERKKVVIKGRGE